MKIIYREKISQDWSEMLTPEEGISGEVVIAHGSVKTRSEGVVL